MVYVPNSFSKANVNVQNSPSRPKVIAKNISPTPVQVNKKVVPRKDVKKMLEEADKQGVDKGEIIQGLLDKGYDIEDKQTFLQQVGQVGKDIAGGTLAGFSTLPTNIIGGALKGLGSIPIAPGLDLPKTPMQEALTRTGENIKRYGEETARQNIAITGARPEAIGTKIGEQVAPLSTAIVGGAATGLTKLGAGAIGTVSKGIAQRSIPTVLKGLGTAGAVGVGEQAIYDVASEGKTTPGSLSVGGLFGIGGAGVIAGAPVVSKAVGKQLSKVRPFLSKGLTESAETSVSKALRPTTKKMKQLTERISPEFLRKGVRGSRESMLKMAKNNVEKFGAQIDDAIEAGALDNITIPKSSIDKVLHEAKLTTMVGNKVVNDTKYTVVAKLQDMISQFPEAIQGREARAIRQILDDIVYATKGGIGAEDLSYKNGLVKSMANTLRSELSKAAPDLANLNKEFSFYKTLEDVLDETITRTKPQSGMLRKGASMLFAGSQDTGIAGKIMNYIGSKVFLDATSSATRNTLSAKVKYNLAKAIATGDPYKINMVVSSINKQHNVGLPEMKALPAPKATPVAPGGLPQVKQPIAPTTRTKQVLESGMENVKQPISKKPVAPKTQLKQAIDSKKVSPKTPKKLQTPSVVSKVDDALHSAGKMDEEYIPGQDISNFTYDKYKKTVLSESPSVDETDIKRMYQSLVNDGTIKAKTVTQTAKSIDTPVKKELSDKGGALTVKPNNQLKFNQGDSYEPVRLVVNDKDAMVARYGALRNKDMLSLSGKPKLSEGEKLEMKRILKDLGIDDATATKRHQFLKDEAKRVRSSSEQVLHEINDDFRTAKSLEPSDLTESIKKAKAEGKTFEEFVEGNTYYRGETGGGGNYYSTDFDFARDFTPSGLDSEVVKKVVSPSDIFKAKELPFAGNVKDIDNAVAQAKKQGKKAILVSEGNGQPNSIFVFDKTAINNGKVQLRTERDKLTPPTTPAISKDIPQELIEEAKKYKSAEEFVGKVFVKDIKEGDVVYYKDSMNNIAKATYKGKNGFGDLKLEYIGDGPLGVDGKNIDPSKLYGKVNSTALQKKLDDIREGNIKKRIDFENTRGDYDTYKKTTDIESQLRKIREEATRK